LVIRWPTFLTSSSARPGRGERGARRVGVAAVGIEPTGEDLPFLLTGALRPPVLRPSQFR